MTYSVERFGNGTSELSGLREEFLERKKQAEAFFLRNPPTQEIRKSKNGARAVVLHQEWLVPADPKNKNNDKLRIGVYVPGMFQMDKQNMGNHPLETKLMAGLFNPDLDALVVLKTEGTNKQAYAGQGQGLVAEMAVGVLTEQVDKIRAKLNLPAEIGIDFQILGYSEGGSQGASIALKIVESGLGVVESFTCLGGAGLAGAERQEESRPAEIIWRRIKANRSKMEPDIGKWIEKKEDFLWINKEVISGRKEKGDGLDFVLGKSQVDKIADVRNVGRWIIRLIKGQMGFSGNVPYERVKALFTYNQDYEKLVESGVKVKVMAGTEDEFFSAEEVIARIRKLRKSGEVSLVVSNVGHDFAHNYPSGVAMVTALMGKK